MTSKWIDEVSKNLNDILDACKRIDVILRETMNTIDSEELYERIKKELNGTD